MVPTARSVCRTRENRSSPRAWFGLAILLALLLAPTLALAQSSSSKAAQAIPPPKGYLLPQEQGLEMMVHILGEVQKPGEYRVPDNTDLLELLAKAGGPTEYANLSWVKIRRVMPVELSATRNVTRLSPSVSVMDVNLEGAWKKKNNGAVPRLVPGDVVVVSRNSWFGYKRMATVLRDVAVVASAYFLYLRVVED